MHEGYPDWGCAVCDIGTYVCQLEEGDVTSPFSYNLPPAKPVVLKPLKYCEFRVAIGEFHEKDTRICEIFACSVLEGMAFCNVHTEIIMIELAKEVGNGPVSDQGG